MTQGISIWRWQVEGDLDAQFTALIAAAPDQFATLAARMAGDDLPSLADTQDATEAKLRAMGLPEDVLQTTLEGFRAMVAEQEEAQEIFEDEGDDGYDGRGGAGRVGATLASSHMFFDDPYASLGHAEIDAQVGKALAGYKAAIAKAVGIAGQSFAAYLGVTDEQLNGHDAFDAQMAAGIEGAVWVWELRDAVFALTQWQEDKELPIDLEFHRYPRATLKALKETLLQ